MEAGRHRYAFRFSATVGGVRVFLFGGDRRNRTLRPPGAGCLQPRSVGRRKDPREGCCGPRTRCRTSHSFHVRSGALSDALLEHDAVVNLATSMPSTATFVFRRAWADTERVRMEGSAAVVDAATPELRRPYSAGSPAGHLRHRWEGRNNGRGPAVGNTISTPSLGTPLVW